MANYRQVHVKIWKDNWFLDLTPEHKLLYIYLFSNDLTSLSGIYQISQKVIAFETGLDRKWVADALEYFQVQGKIEYEDGYIWIKKLRKYHETSSPKVQTHIKNDLDNIPDIPLKTRYIAYYQPDIPYTYPMDTESQEEEEEVKEEKEEEVERAPAPTSDIPFSNPETAQAYSTMQDHTSQDVAQLYRDVTGQMQPLSANIDKAFSDLELVLDHYDTVEDAIAPGKYIYDLWCQKRSAKTGKTYSPLNIAWIEKWLENLARDQEKAKVAKQRERSYKTKVDADINRVAKKFSLSEIFSSGGGRQSTAVLVLVSQGIVQYDAFVFANVGEDSENPDTIDYLHNYTLPFAEKHGIRFEVVQKTRFGEPDTIYKELVRGNRSIRIPVHLPKGGSANRSCTQIFKVGVIDKWCREQGVTSAIVGLGISIDEMHRARSTEWNESKFYRGLKMKREYPLIDLHMNNAQCANLVEAAGLPPAPRSSCYFCPFHRHSEWVLMRSNNPDLFKKAVLVDEFTRAKREIIMSEPCYIHPSRKPLSVMVGEQANFLDEFDNCESGYCFT